jgi:thiosulfate/3-mercaptopyruvate sulfurtransferase
MSRVVVSAAEAAELAAAGAIILDGTVQLAAPRFDGDYRPISGAAVWRAEHLPGSRHLDLLARWVDETKPFHFGYPDPAALAAQLGADGIDGSTPVICYDSAGGPWASRLWWTLRNAGVEAFVLDGGLAAWKAAGYPLADGDGQPAIPVAAPDAIDLGGWVDVGEVLRISNGELPGLLVCALGPGQFDGSEPTRYSRRGHIPRSVNLPARGLVDDAGLLLGSPELDERLAGLSALAGPDDPLVIYCGGGISACLAALGLVSAGYHNIRIYDGSIEEWSARPELPLVSANTESDRNDMTAVEQLRALVAPTWEAAINHRFVNELLAGTIADDALGSYLAQDYQFFIYFLNELGQAMASADTLEAKVRLGQQIGFVANDEDAYFQLAFEKLGVPEAEQHNPALKPATAGFAELITRIVETRDYRQIILLLYIAETLYLDWAKRSAAEGKRPPRPEHYGWIDVHEGEQFRDWVAFLETEVNRVADPDDPALQKLIRDTVQLEWQFFEDAYTG